MTAKKIAQIILCLFSVAILLACSPSLPKNEDKVPRVSMEDAKSALENGTAVIVDVRSSEAYAKSHIPGALSIPLSEFENNPSQLSLKKNQWIITYCT